MKKLIVMVIVLSLITACQKKRVEDTGSGGSTQCISLEDYYKETTTNGKVTWLKEYGELVCKDTLDNAILLAHQVDTTEISNLHKESFNIKWNVIRDFVEPNFYNAYLSFTFDSNEDVKSIMLIPDYQETVPCYSVPFIMFIGQQHSFTNDCSIEFTTGDLNSKQVLFVIAKDESDNILGYYNNSGNPL
jgi:hypothetical protein